MPTYTVGTTFTYTICSSSVDYVVEENNNTRECVIRGLKAAIDAESDVYFDLVTTSSTSTQLLLTAVEPGVPFDGALTYSEAPPETYFTETTTTPNVSVLGPPSSNPPASNSVTYTTDEAGGRYKAVLTLKVGCDYTVCEYNSTIGVMI